MDCFRSYSLPVFSFTEQLDMNFQSFTGFSGDNFFSQQVSSEFSGDVVGNLQHAVGDNLRVVPAATSSKAQHNITVAKAEDEVCETKKRKAGDASRNSSSTTSSLAPSTGKNETSSCGGKKVKMSEEKLGKEVVHVRARRGQATDSHSLAERVRRGKINERLRCLQDIVPGCYKTMGMAVMLDEIINYVQSLQNQVEFLSMKLSAASSYYDFNSDTNAMEMMQRAKAAEAQEVDRLMREGYGGASSCINSTTTTIWPY